MSNRLRSFVFTLNNHTDQNVEELKQYGEQYCKYLIFGSEVGESGTPHLQGYAQLKKQTAFNKLGKLYKWHIEPTRGTPEQAADYCKKDGKFVEIGELQTANTGGKLEQDRWATMVKQAEAGNVDDIKTENPREYAIHYNKWKNIAKDHAPRPTDAPNTTGFWIHGASGCGKSREARQWCDENNKTYYAKMCNKWWDNYQGEPIVIIDDIDTKHEVLGHHLKIWADRYAFLGESKGSAQWIRPEKIIVTSQYKIEDIWLDEATREALNRRFCVLHMISYDSNHRLFR